MKPAAREEPASLPACLPACRLAALPMARPARKGIIAFALLAYPLPECAAAAASLQGLDGSRSRLVSIGAATRQIRTRDRRILTSLRGGSTPRDGTSHDLVDGEADEEANEEANEEAEDEDEDETEGEEEDESAEAVSSFGGHVAVAPSEVRLRRRKRTGLGVALHGSLLLLFVQFLAAALLGGGGSAAGAAGAAGAGVSAAAEALSSSLSSSLSSTSSTSSPAFTPNAGFLALAASTGLAELLLCGAIGRIPRLRCALGSVAVDSPTEADAALLVFRRRASLLPPDRGGGDLFASPLQRLRGALARRLGLSLDPAVLVAVTSDNSKGINDRQRESDGTTSSSSSSSSSSASGIDRFFFTFQHQVWEWCGVRPSASLAAYASSASALAWRRVSPPCRRPLSDYRSAMAEGNSSSSSAEGAIAQQRKSRRGLWVSDAAAAVAARAAYGPNSCVAAASYSSSSSSSSSSASSLSLSGGQGGLVSAFVDRMLAPLALWQVVSCLLSAADGKEKAPMTRMRL